MYPEPVEGGKANRNRQRAVGTARVDAEGAGCDTLSPALQGIVQHLQEDRNSLSLTRWQQQKNYIPSHEKEKKKKSKRNQEQPLKRCIVSFRFLNGIISKQPIKNESECVL